MKNLRISYLQLKAYPDTVTRWSKRFNLLTITAVNLLV